MTPGLRAHRSASLTVTMATGLPEEMRDLTRELVDFHSRDQGRGDATGLLAEVCREADQWWVTLIILVRPFGRGGMDEAALERFYRRHGFTRLQDSPVLMGRPPRAPVIEMVH